MKILALVLAGLFLISPFARAVDEDDVYTDAYFGLRLDQSSQLQVGGIVGYGVADTVGIGLVFDDLISRSAADLSSNGTLIAAEGRWFLEPFEIASGIGGYWAINQPFRAVLLLSGAFLVPVTSSLAARLELRGQYLSSGVTAILSDIGVRFVF